MFLYSQLVLYLVSAAEQESGDADINKGKVVKMDTLHLTMGIFFQLQGYLERMRWMSEICQGGLVRKKPSHAHEFPCEATS